MVCHTHNVSVSYLLKTAFQYEINNGIDIEIDRLHNKQSRDHLEDQRLALLLLVREYLSQRTKEMSQ